MRKTNSKSKNRDSLVHSLKPLVFPQISSAEEREVLEELNGSSSTPPQLEDDEDEFSYDELWEEDGYSNASPTTEADIDDTAESPLKSASSTEDPPAADKGETASNLIDQLRHLVLQAKQGNNQAVEKIRQILDDHPSLAHSIGDLASQVEQLLISVVANGNALASEAMQRNLEQFKSDLAGDTLPGPLERMAIQRVVVSWMMCQYTDRATLIADAAGAKAVSWGKRQECAERRYGVAIKSLELARKMSPAKAAPASPTDASHSKPAESGDLKHRNEKPCNEAKKLNDSMDVSPETPAPSELREESSIGQRAAC